MKLSNRKDLRIRRHRRVRRKISGTSERPRMAITRSNRYLYVQFINDEDAVTLASVSTVGADGKTKNIETAQALGQQAAAAALEKGIKQVVVDRGGFQFHGRIKAIVDAAVEGGLSISAKSDKRPDANEETK